MSKIDFAPLHTTQVGCSESAYKSAETSFVSLDPIWTPPIPPVAKNLILKYEAIEIVLATVVAPFCLLNIDRDKL